MKEQNIVIKKAKKEDIFQVIKLQSSLIRFHKKTSPKSEDLYGKKSKLASPIFKKFVQKHLQSKNSLILIAYDNKKPIGYCFSFVKENIPIYKIKKYGYISDIYVGKKYRGKFLGKMLIDITKKFFKKKKIKFIELSVRSFNKEAIRFYQKYSFKEYSKTMRIRI